MTLSILIVHIQREGEREKTGGGEKEREATDVAWIIILAFAACCGK